jgi:hypothetical protein
MADGLLGGFGDFLLGGGKYADPNAINPQYGVPESDVRQAGINTLANVSALLLAAGQPLTGAQRAQMLAQIGPAFGGMGTDLYKAAQTRLMTAQGRAAQEEISELDVMRKKKAEDPEGLAKAMGVNVDLVKAMSTKSLVDMAKQITIKRATTEPGQAAITEAFARVAGGAPAATPTAAPTDVAAAPTSEPVAGSAIYQSAPIPSGTTPQDRATIEAYKAALNDPRVARNPELVKTITETLDRLLPGVREGAIKQAQTRATTLENKPKAQMQIASADEQNRLVTGKIDDALKLLDSEGRFVAGTAGSRLSGLYEPATDFQNQLNTIKATIGFDRLQRMRQESPTGGALGAVAVRELDRLEATLGSLDAAQSPAELKKNLNTIKDALTKYNQTMRQGYKLTYGEDYKAPEGAQQPAAAPAQSGFGNPNDVKAAVQSGKITREQGLQILRSQFGFQ